MRCAHDPTRIERCLVCTQKCQGFMDWYADNKEYYNNLAEHYTATYPNKYELEVIIMTKKKEETISAPVTNGKPVAIVDANNTIMRVMALTDLKSGKIDPKEYSDKRIIELTGKEYELIISVALKTKQLAKFK